MRALEDIERNSAPSRFLGGTRDLADVLLLTAGCLSAFFLLKFNIAILVAGWFCLTLVIVRSDLDYLVIPNWASAGIALLGLAHAVLSSAMPAEYSAFTPGAVVGPIERAVVTFVCAAVFGWTFARLTGREGLGFGDVKLSAALALWLEPYDFLIALELASFAALGLVAVTQLRHKSEFKDGFIPFGAFLAPSGWLVFMCGIAGEALRPWHLPFW
jgi:prepilin signal peptidase PulO-like enzyme (type II secretory pathway)